MAVLEFQPPSPTPSGENFAGSLQAIHINKRFYSIPGGAWWAAVYGVAQSRTRLKRLSTSSSSMHQDLCVVTIDPEQMRQVKCSRCQRNKWEEAAWRAVWAESYVQESSQVKRGAEVYVQGSQKARGLIWRWTGGWRYVLSGDRKSSRVRVS